MLGIERFSLGIGGYSRLMSVVVINWRVEIELQVGSESHLHPRTDVNATPHKPGCQHSSQRIGLDCTEPSEKKKFLLQWEQEVASSNKVCGGGVEAGPWAQ